MLVQAQITLDSIINYELVKDNPLWRFGLLVLVIILTMIASKVVQVIMEAYSKKIEARFGRTLITLVTVAIAKPVYVAMFGIGIMACKFTLDFSNPVEKDFVGISPSIGEMWLKVARAVFATAIAYAMYRLVDVVEYYLHKAMGKTNTKLDVMLMQIVRKSLQVAIVIIAALFIAENIFPDSIKSLLVGAGVGGMAIAFAAKETIANFFGSVTIFADKPFQIGDVVKIGAYTGTIEEVGIRSSRIRTPEGHLVTIPNNTIANETVENVGRRPSIIRKTDISITYGSGYEKAQKAINIIKEILAAVPEVNSDSDNLPKVHFSEFKECWLNINVCYWVKPADYWLWMEVNEKINFEILKRFDAEKIEFAFPTQTLYVKKEQ